MISRDVISLAFGQQGSPYRLDPNTIRMKNGQIEGTILKTTSEKEKIKLPLVVTFLDSGSTRIQVDEEKRQKGDIELRHDSKVRKERYNEAAGWSLTGAGLQPQKLSKFDKGAKSTTVTWGSSNQFSVIITYAPFGIELFANDKKQVVLNERGFFNFEHWRPKVEKPVTEEGKDEDKKVEPLVPQEDESTWWEETFGGNTDTKPRGPESISMDISFPGFSHVYGLPEHAGPLSLKQTRGGESNYDQPYRFFNADVFEYELDNPMTLYGAIPFMQAHNKDFTVGVFWLNAAETWVDIVKTQQGTTMGLGGHTDTLTHWFSESGVMDIFVMLTQSPKELSQKYAELTGYTAMPQMFAIAYHQCRWNYVSDEDVKDVDRKFDKHNIPYDVIWLDLEYTDDKQYFVWDQDNFPDPIGMEKQLDEHERKLVIIIDPHIKNKAGYQIVEELKSKDLAVKNKDGNFFEGWCWPGSSHWIDCFNPAAREWWKSLFPYNKMKGVQSNVWIWNDMNEPSVFNGPEVSMPRDNVHYGNWEHRDVHNLNGMTFHNATHHALVSRAKGESVRPFVLTRSFFAGSQRLGAMWTGDNQASWPHLAASIPMVLNQGVAGFPFAGADVGGFFGNPSKELQTRWYQAGAFYPFFRAHAHIDTRRREPYLLGEPYTEIMAQAVRLRYSLLPSWYTAFREAATEGVPIVRAQYYVHPHDEAGFDIDDQFYIGSTGLLVKPVVTEGGESVDIYLADDETYFDYSTYKTYSGAGKRHSVTAPLDKIPLLMQGGNIFARKDRPRRSSGLMKFDPYTLVVVLGRDGRADGELYIDDGETYDFEHGGYIHRNFTFGNGSLKSQDVSSSVSTKDTKKKAVYLKTMDNVLVERIIIVNAPKSLEGKSEVKVTGQSSKSGGTASMSYHVAKDGNAAWAVIRNPAVKIGADWSIDLGVNTDAKGEL
ncbi:glucosidase II [Lithohypha guttulata]|uniref:alpha-glucosidase n=1 Tax=Lithohypha guttulata TaxID=1690604 RepID=A0AAN7SXN9_9EURO|nr:glucosidase II [Lithohypha guttulata]